MVSKLDVIVKSITLLYREKVLADKTKTDQTVDDSKDLIKTVLSVFKDDKKPLQGGDSVIISDLQNLLLDMLTKPDNFDKETLTQSLSIILKNNESILKILVSSIEADMEVAGLKTSIISLRKVLNSFYREMKMVSLVNETNYKLMTGRIENSIQETISNMLLQLEALNNDTRSSKDPAVLDELDFSDKESLEATIIKVQDLSEDKGKFITGWKSMNKMLNGGFRRGEQWVISALQHNYKSGLMQSLFVQFCTLNKPVLIDPNKKPLIVYISFEDDMNIIIEFMYRYMYYNEYREIPTMDKLTSQEISNYVVKKLSHNGFHAKIMRVNPAEWSYKNIFNKVLEWEADGYEIQVLMLDYLSKLPTTYCDRSGPSGTDVRDLFNRLRNFCSAKSILCITPHQISTEALQMYRSGVTGFDFIEEIRSKNYYSESKQIPQVVDGEIYIVKGKVGKDWYLYLGKGKHRSPIITPDEDKNMMLPFPKGAPITEDIHNIESIDNLTDSNNNEFDF